MAPGPLSTPASRRFPNPGWAWPTGSTEQLLIAAACPDATRAARAFTDWMASTDIDAVTFPEQRLLVRIANRFPASRLEVPNRARLTGLVRMLWTKSRLAMHNNEPVLRGIRAAGIDFVVLKGAAQSALDMRNLKGRIAHDVDILIAASDRPRVMALLFSAGWYAPTGQSALCLEAQGDNFRSLNFVAAPFGNIDVHLRAYHTIERQHPVETGIWARSVPASLTGVDVLVPTPTDQLLVAIDHGRKESQHHVDWIADCAQLVLGQQVDWDLFLANARALEMLPSVRILFPFLRDVLGIALPDQVRDRLSRAGRRASFDYLSALLLMHPRQTHSAMSNLGRSFCRARLRKKMRAADRLGAAPAQGQVLRMRRTRCNAVAWQTPFALQHKLPDLGARRRFRIAVDFGTAGLCRRHVLEINTSGRHVARLKFRDFKGSGRLCVAARVTLPPGVDAADLWVEARASGSLPVQHSQAEAARLAALPFRLSSLFGAGQ